MNRLYRSNTNRVIGGVCGGLAEYFKVDALLVRILFVAFGVLFSGTGFPLYLLLWVFVPTRDQAFTTNEDGLRQNVDDIKSTFRDWRDRGPGTWEQRWQDVSASDRTLIGGAILVAVGLLLLVRSLPGLGFLNDLWPLGVIAVGILILIHNLRK